MPSVSQLSSTTKQRSRYSYLPELITPPPEGVFWLASSDDASDADVMSDVVPPSEPSAGDGVTELSNTWSPAVALPLNVLPVMFGTLLFRNNTGPCCAVLLVKVQETMLAS